MFLFNPLTHKTSIPAFGASKRAVRHFVIKYEITFVNCPIPTKTTHNTHYNSVIDKISRFENVFNAKQCHR